MKKKLYELVVKSYKQFCVNNKKKHIVVTIMSYKTELIYLRFNLRVQFLTKLPVALNDLKVFKVINKLYNIDFSL